MTGGLACLQIDRAGETGFVSIRKEESSHNFSRLD